MDQELQFSVSEFVAVLNQTLDYAYPVVTVMGELANFRVSKNRWVYFDLKDDAAAVRFFGTVHQLPGPLEDGMMLAVTGNPRLHPLYGFSINVLRLTPVGQGSIKKAAELLQAKLKAEGLFDPERKRVLPCPPRRIGLIASGESAAYRDFVKIINARWGGVDIVHIDVQVQGEVAPAQIVAAIAQANSLADPPEVLVITRGGGSAEDLQAFSTEQVTRAVAASRIPTLVAIGHEVDISLAELAADQRASTPSNAAELLVPDRRALIQQLQNARRQLAAMAAGAVQQAGAQLERHRQSLHDTLARLITTSQHNLSLKTQLLEAFNPQAALARGYALVRIGDELIRSGTQIKPEQQIAIQLFDARVTAITKRVTMEHKEHPRG
ncbi:MAG TPA: exodeoxyribonuclease VII large subunit [Patescibacteria group bacterium]|nr:exodeoxyribonuclease VII large subunit [Patescibacteria group bacterium]